MNILRLTSACRHSLQRLPTTTAISTLPKHPLSISFTHDVFRQPPVLKSGFYQQRRTFTNSKPSNNGHAMSLAKKIGLSLALGGCVLTSVALHASETSSKEQIKIESAFINTMHSKVADAIANTKEIPGLKPEELGVLRTKISDTWSILVKEGCLVVSGTDKDVRPNFVALQGIIEHVIALALNNEITSLNAVIHTPMPATPLCTTGVVSDGLVNPSIADDPARLYTVLARTTIVRNLLAKGGILHVVYPEGGLKKRTEEQQKIYQQELTNYPKHLFDAPLHCEEIPTDLIGATYLIQDKAGKMFVFSIKMTQAKDPKETGHFGLWFGSIDNPVVKERVTTVSSFLEANGLNVLKL
jgi:hypothetical protein